MPILRSGEAAGVPPNMLLFFFTLLLLFLLLLFFFTRDRPTKESATYIANRTTTTKLQGNLNIMGTYLTTKKQKRKQWTIYVCVLFGFSLARSHIQKDVKIGKGKIQKEEKEFPKKRKGKEERNALNYDKNV